MRTDWRTVARLALLTGLTTTAAGVDGAQEPAAEETRWSEPTELALGRAVVARVTLIDPDGAPGSGDELFETVMDGGVLLDFGTGQIRKAGLDAIFRTALVISF